MCCLETTLEGHASRQHHEEEKKKSFLRFCQPVRLINRGNHGNKVPSFMTEVTVKDKMMT